MNDYTFLIPLYSCIAYIVLIAVAIIFGQRKVRDIFLLYLSIAMLWSFFSFQARLNLFPGQLLLWHKLLIIFMFSVPVVYYHFVSNFTDRISIHRLWLGYGLIVLLAIFTFSGYVIRNTEVVDGLWTYDLGIAEYFLLVFGASFMLMPIFSLIQSYRHSLDSQTRNRTAYLLIGAVLVLSLSLTNLSGTLAKYPIDHIGNLINALLITYVVVRYQLLDIKVVVRMGLGYSGLTILITAMYVLLLFVLQSIIQNWSGYSSLALVAVFALLLAVLFNPLRKKIQEWVDRLFYRETYDYRKMLLKFSKGVSNIINLNELAQDMLYPITKALHVNWASLLIPDASSGYFTTQFNQQANGKPVTNLSFSRDNPIVTWLTREGKPLRRDHIEILSELKGLWEEERDELKVLEVELLCPIVSKGELIGILALGTKQSGTSYSDEELDLLMAMASSAAVAIENAMVLDALKKQQAQVRQLLIQMVQAQEDERKRISVELHDSVTQWLVGASFRLQACDAILPESDSKEAREELREVENTLNKSVKELRHIMTGLHPPALAELGLIHALGQVARELDAAGIACDFETTGTPIRLEPSLEITIFRIVQEASANVRKHSGASQVIISLQFNSEDIVVKIRDNGRGFDLPQTLDRAISVGSLGLFGMRQRAEAVGCTLEIETRPGAGASITFKLPLPSNVCEEGSEKPEGGK